MLHRVEGIITKQNNMKDSKIQVTVLQSSVEQIVTLFNWYEWTIKEFMKEYNFSPIELGRCEIYEEGEEVTIIDIWIKKRDEPIDWKE